MSESDRGHSQGGGGADAADREARRARARARKRQREGGGSSSDKSARSGLQKTVPMTPSRRDDAGYEFSDNDNERFRTLAGLMQLVGIVSVVLGFVLGVFMFPKEAENAWPYLFWLASVVLPIAGGIWTTNAGSSFKRVATTEGNDVGHVMDAVKQLTRLFTLQAVVVVLGIAVIVLGMVLVSLRIMPGTLFLR